MGLFDKVKSNLDTTLEKGKEISKDLFEKNDAYYAKQREKRDQKEQAKIDEVLGIYNIFEGIKVTLILPEEEIIVKSKHGGLTKGVATLGFGLIGLAATSGVKQRKQAKTVKTELQVVDKGLVFKKATSDKKDFRIPYDNIVKLSIATVKGLRGDKELPSLILTLLENQELRFIPQIKNKHFEIVRNHLLLVVNERATGIENEEAGWGLESSKVESLPETETPMIESNDSASELEKIVDMYTKGLLTDDEFAAMKKRIIEK